MGGTLILSSTATLRCTRTSSQLLELVDHPLLQTDPVTERGAEILAGAILCASQIPGCTVRSQRLARACCDAWVTCRYAHAAIMVGEHLDAVHRANNLIRPDLPRANSCFAFTCNCVTGTQCRASARVLWKQRVSPAICDADCKGELVRPLL